MTKLTFWGKNSFKLWYENILKTLRVLILINPNVLQTEKDTSIPRGWCRPGGWGCWGWGRRELSAAACWPNCPVFCSWHTAAASSGPASRPVPLTIQARRLRGARQESQQAEQGRWRSWCGRGPERGIHQHGPARGEGTEVGTGAEGLTNRLARHQRQGLWYCWHNLPLWKTERRVREKTIKRREYSGRLCSDFLHCYIILCNNVGVGLKDAYSMSFGLKGQCLNQSLWATKHVKDVDTKRTSIFKGIVYTHDKLAIIYIL